MNFRGIVSHRPLALRIHTDMPKRFRSLRRIAQKGLLESIHHVTRLLLQSITFNCGIYVSAHRQFWHAHCLLSKCAVESKFGRRDRDDHIEALLPNAQFREAQVGWRGKHHSQYHLPGFLTHLHSLSVVQLHHCAPRNRLSSHIKTPDCFPCMSCTERLQMQFPKYSEIMQAANNQVQQLVKDITNSTSESCDVEDHWKHMRQVQV